MLCNTQPLISVVYFLFMWHHRLALYLLFVFFTLWPWLTEQSLPSTSPVLRWSANTWQSYVTYATSPMFHKQVTWPLLSSVVRGCIYSARREGHHEDMVELVPAGSCIIHLLGGLADIFNNTTTYCSLSLSLGFAAELLCDLGKVACPSWASILSSDKFGV